jgi:Septum formation
MKSLRLIILVVVIVGGVAVAFLFRDRLSGSASELRVGDCFQVPAGDTVDDVQHSPCTEAHDGEVLVVADYPGGDSYPTSDDFDSWVQTECVDHAFADYVGASFDSRQDIDLGYLYPQSDGWASGDRQMICYLTPASGGTVSAPFRAAP